MIPWKDTIHITMLVRYALRKHRGIGQKYNFIDDKNINSIMG